MICNIEEIALNLRCSKR